MLFYALYLRLLKLPLANPILPEGLVNRAARKGFRRVEYPGRQLRHGCVGLGFARQNALPLAPRHRAVIGVYAALVAAHTRPAQVHSLVFRGQQHREFAHGHVIFEAEAVVGVHDAAPLGQTGHFFKQRVVAPDIRERAFLHEFGDGHDLVSVPVQDFQLQRQAPRDGSTAGHIVAVLLEDNLPAEKVGVLFERGAHGFRHGGDFGL